MKFNNLKDASSNTVKILCHIVCFEGFLSWPIGIYVRFTEFPGFDIYCKNKIFSNVHDCSKTKQETLQDQLLNLINVSIKHNFKMWS